MALIISASDVFEFMGTDSGQQEKHLQPINNLITRKQKELEVMLRRSLESKTASSLVIYNGKGCEIDEGLMFLKGEYRDFYNITALSETGTALTESTAYNDGNDYIPNYGQGVIERVGDYWSLAQNAFTISGTYGYLNANATAREEIKQILIEMVAAASGLWFTSYQTDQGNVRQQRYTITKTTNAMISNHINYSL